MVGFSEVLPKAGVYFAMSEGEGILLDLDTDRYIALTRPSACIWRGLEQQDPRESVVDELGALLEVSPEIASQIIDSQLQVWQAHGLVRHRDRAGTTVMPRRIVYRLVGSRAIEASAVDAARLSLRQLVYLASAFAWTHAMLPRMGIASLLRRIQDIDAPVGSVDQRRLLQSLRAHRALRLLFAKGRGDCLRRSLTLTTALRWQGIPAELCIGVHKLPLEAHCWVELGDTILNETKVVTDAFEPIARF